MLTTDSVYDAPAVVKEGADSLSDFRGFTAIKLDSSGSKRRPRVRTGGVRWGSVSRRSEWCRDRKLGVGKRHEHLVEERFLRATRVGLNHSLTTCWIIQQVWWDVAFMSPSCSQHQLIRLIP